MSDLVSREYMKSLGATCIASRSKDGTLFPIVAIDELPPADPTHPTPSNTLGALDCVDRQEAIDAFWKLEAELRPSAIDAVLDMLKNLPSVQPEDWMERNKECILQAGMEGREIEFRIGGRLFAIREKAQ
jgi:hypothetical protein